MNRRLNLGRALLVATIAIAAASTAFSPAMASGAQDERRVSADPGGKRLKVCLALSGGGARGAAHVGVLKVLEELRVPIDCIAGTSMGALVGGAYATGMTLAEMDVLLRSINTELLIRETPPREERSMRRKEDDYRPYITPDLGYKDGSIGFGKGVVSGVGLETVLRELTKVKGYHRFDELPIQYRAIATDLVTGRAVVFRDGEMANVMRASMSVPGAVAPAEVGGMMLVDGMLTQNLPVETARAMGADIVIAVNVGTPLLKREELSGILGVTSQMLSILTEQNVQTSLAALRPGDILITPELEGFSTGDFDALPRIAPLGEGAARKVTEQLARLAVSPAEYAALRRRQQVALVPDLRPIDEIRFAPMQSVNPRTARAAMDTQPGEPIDQPRLDRDMRRLYGTGYFEHVNYSILEEPNRRILVVDAVEKSWGLDYVRLGLGFVTDMEGDAFFNLIGSYRKTWINALGAEWRNTLQIGRSSGVSTEFYQPLRPEGDFFVAPFLAASRRTTELYSGENQIATYDIGSVVAGADLGTNFGRYGELRVGLSRGALKSQYDSGPPALAPVEGKIAQGAASARLLFDRLDSVQFPRGGWRAGFRIYESLEQLGAETDYTKWDADGIFAYSLGDHTFQLAWKFGGKLGSDRLPRHDLFQWGGFLQQSGYATGQLLGERLSFGRLMYYHRILRGTLFEGAYGGFSLEGGKMDSPLVPGSPTGLLIMQRSFFCASIYVFLNASEASHSSVVTNRVAICTPAAPSFINL